MDKDKRKELMEAYKQIKVYMGVYQIKNNENSKIDDLKFKIEKFNTTNESNQNEKTNYS